MEHADGIRRTGRLWPLYWKGFYSRRLTQIHLIPEEMDGWDLASRALCGKQVNIDTAREPTPEQTFYCKKCVQIARQKGLRW